MQSIVIGAKEHGTKIADHASSIDTLISVDKSGNTREISFKPASSNPGQETMQFIDGNFSDADAFIIGLMQGPPNSKIKIVQEPDKSVGEIIEQYKKEEKSYSKENSTSSGKKEEKYNVPKQDGSGGGIGNIGRNPECEPEDYKEIGQGSGRRVTNASPQRKAYQDTTQDTANNQNTIGDTIRNIVKKYSNAQTNEQKEVISQAIGKYLKEADDNNLKGEEAEKYVAKKLEEDGHSKNTKSDSQKSSEKPNSKGASKEAD